MSNHFTGLSLGPPLGDHDSTSATYTHFGRADWISPQGSSPTICFQASTHTSW
jgi:hypothetical protein